MVPTVHAASVRRRIELLGNLIIMLWVDSASYNKPPLSALKLSGAIALDIITNTTISCLVIKASILGSVRSEHLTFLNGAELFNYGSVTKVRRPPRDFIIYYQNLNLLVLCTTLVSKHATFILRTAQSRNEARTLGTWLAPVGTVVWLVGPNAEPKCETPIQAPL